MCIRDRFSTPLACPRPASPARWCWTERGGRSGSSSLLSLIHILNTTGDLVKVTVTATAGDKTAQCTVYCRGSGASSSGSTGGQSGNTGSTGGNTGTTGTIAPNTPATIVNAENGLNIRSGPGKEYDVVASASNGAKITVLELSLIHIYPRSHGRQHGHLCGL